MLHGTQGVVWRTKESTFFLPCLDSGSDKRKLNAHLQAHSIVSIESILTKIEGEKE
jgi:hypothetical protein